MTSGANRVIINPHNRRSTPETACVRQRLFAKVRAKPPNRFPRLLLTAREIGASDSRHRSRMGRIFHALIAFDSVSRAD